MKIAVACKSILLQKSLELFLKKYISAYKYSDFIISDRKISVDKPLFLISKDKEANLHLPFTKSQLILEIKSFYKKNFPDGEYKQSKEDFSLLEKKLELLCNKFQKELIDTIKEHYER